MHHVRVVDAGGVLWLVPLRWLPPYSLQKAEMAFDPLAARFLHIVQTVDHDLIWKVLADVTGMPAGLTPVEMVARLKQRHGARELVH